MTSSKNARKAMTTSKFAPIEKTICTVADAPLDKHSRAVVSDLNMIFGICFKISHHRDAISLYCYAVSIA